MVSIRNDLNTLCPKCNGKMTLDILQERECVECGRTEVDREVCENGHFICDACRRKMGSKIISRICSSTESKNPIEILMKIMDDPSIRMHDLKHHTAVGSALMAAYKNCGGDIDLEKNLREMDKRGSWFPGGLCGLAGTCGAAASVGSFYSIITNTTPHSQETWGDVNLLVSKCLFEIGSINGPRCCKRNSFIAIGVAVKWVKEKLSIEMDYPDTISCKFFERNEECIREKCPFFKS